MWPRVIVSKKARALAQIDSAKSVFDFESPCDGKVIRRLHIDGETVAMTDPIVEIETSDELMKDWIPPAVGRCACRGHYTTIAKDSFECGLAARSGYIGRWGLSARTRGLERRTGAKFSGYHRGIRLSSDRNTRTPLGRCE